MSEHHYGPLLFRVRAGDGTRLEASACTMPDGERLLSLRIVPGNCTGLPAVTVRLGPRMAWELARAMPRILREVFQRPASSPEVVVRRARCSCSETAEQTASSNPR